MKHLVFLFFIFIGIAVHAQKADSGFVNIHVDPKIALVVNKPVENRGFVGKIRGYRVQIYNGADRKKASQSKLEFMRSYPGIRSYLVYNNPSFRVRVGDFKSRREAMEFYKNVSKTFTPCMIVPEVINVSIPPKQKTKETDHQGND